MKKFLLVILGICVNATEPYQFCKNTIQQGYSYLCIDGRLFVEKEVVLREQMREGNQFGQGIGIGIGVGYGLAYVGYLCNCTELGGIEIRRIKK